MQNAAFVHLVPEIVALTAAFANAGENGIAAVLCGDVVDQLLNEHRLADARAAEKSNFAALRVRLEQVDDLDAGLQDLRCRALVCKDRSLAVNFPLRRVFGQCAFTVNGFAQHVEHPAERRLADRYADAGSGGLDLHSAREQLTCAQQYAAHARGGKLLYDLHHAHLAVHGDMKRLADGGQLPLFKAAVHDWACDRQDRTFFHCVCASLACRRCAAAPAVISVISCVISA